MYRSHPCIEFVSIDSIVHRTPVLSNSGFGEERFPFQVPGVDSIVTWTIHWVTNTDVHLTPGNLPVRPSGWCPGQYLGQKATFLNPERLSNFVIISFLDPRSQETQNGYGNYTSPRAVDLFTRIQQVSDTGNMGAVIRHHNVHPFNTTVGESFQNVRIRVIALVVTVGRIAQLKLY
jgi:hypothetical protein